MPDRYFVLNLETEEPGEVWICPECGSTTGQPMQWDHGTDPETGYHDAGEGCTECTPGGGK